jgi:hypothetical protein
MLDLLLPLGVVLRLDKSEMLGVGEEGAGR